MQLYLREVATLYQVTCGRAWAFVEITVSRTCPLRVVAQRFDCIHVQTEMSVECVNHCKQPLKHMGD